MNPRKITAKTIQSMIPMPLNAEETKIKTNVEGLFQRYVEMAAEITNLDSVNR